MRFYILLFAFFCIPLTSCMQQQGQGPATSNPSLFGSTKKEMHGIAISVDFCSLQDRVISCRLTAVSKRQNRILNLHGGNATKVQDDTGVSYPTFLAFGSDPTDKLQRSAKLIADTPYHFSLRAENISTQATTIRAIDIIRMDVTGTGSVGYLKMTFANPPMRTPKHLTEKSENNAASVSKTTSTGKTPYQYLFARIEPINENILFDADIKALWYRGAYLHLKSDGSLGHNWSKPGPYAYVPEQYWYIKDNQLIIVFEPDKVTYTFDISEYKFPMITYLDQGGIFKMTAYKKDKGQK